MAQIFTGKEVTEALNSELSQRSALLRDAGTVPTLGIVRLGNRPDDLAYERGAVKRAELTGIDIKKYEYAENMSQEKLIEEIEMINRDETVHGVLIFLPLPSHIDENAVRNALAPEKDVDGITDISQFGVYEGSEKKGYPPCTAEACIKLTEHYGIEFEGKNVAVIGRSQVIGKPVAMMLLKRNATVTICHTRTKNLSEICRDKDIIISAAGHIRTVTEDMMTENQIIVDVAVNFDSDGNMCGDVDRAAAERLVKAFTPVPGGVGTVTTGILMKHVVEAAERKAAKNNRI